MSDKYVPPFTMTDEILNMVIEIGELVGQISAHDSLSTNPKLRRENRIKTIYSSLAIEQNTLTLEQVTDVIDGKRVLAPPAEIREVKNAYEAYDYLISKRVGSISQWKCRRVNNICGIYTSYNPQLTAKQLAATLGLSDRQIERTIAFPKAEGMLKRVGANKNGS